MLASLSNSTRTRGRVGLLAILTAICTTGCGAPEVDRPGTWKSTDIYGQNLRAMLVNPQDVNNGTGTLTFRGDAGSRAATRLLTDRRRALLDASASHIGSASAAPADSGAVVPPGGGSSAGGAQ